MASQGAPSWTDAEIAELLAAYFGDRLSEPQLASLTANVSEAIGDRRARKLGRQPAATNGVVHETSTSRPTPDQNPNASKGVRAHADR